MAATSREPRKGNPTPRIIETSSGILNAIGLQNGGIDNFINEKLPFLRQFDVPIIVNYPNSIASTGDSITRAFNTGSVPFTDAPANSWSTGTNAKPTPADVVAPRR